MVSKLKKVFLGIAIILGLLVLIIQIPVRAEAEPEKGDLRCPTDSEIEDKTVVCKETLDSNGKVVKTEVTYHKDLGNDSYVEIVKTVRKLVDDNGQPGKYDVQFKVRGEVKQKPMEKPAYIVVLWDVSQTMSRNYNTAISAIKNFANSLIPAGTTSSTYNLALVRFTSSAKRMRGFENTNFDNVNFKKVDAGTSYVDEGLTEAMSLLSSVSDGNANKFIVFLGDGNYWTRQSIRKGSADKAVELAKNLKNSGVKIYGMMYSDGTYGNPDKGSSQNLVYASPNVVYEKSKEDSTIYLKSNYQYKIDNGKLTYDKSHGCLSEGSTYISMCTTCVNRGKDGIKYTTYGTCDNDAMSVLTTKYYNGVFDVNSWNSLLANIASDIKGDSKGDIVGGNVSDKVGDNFYLKDNLLGKVQGLDIGNITPEWTVVPKDPFIIDIDQYAGEGWHKTNEDFKLSFETDDGLKEFIVKDNPLVYWKANTLNIPSCSGEAQADSGEVESEIENKYYTRTCYEGYTDSNGNFKSGYTVNAQVNNLATGTKRFGLLNGVGFPTSVTLSTNVACYNKFDYDLYTKDKQSIENSIRQANAEASATIPEDATDEEIAAINSSIEAARKRLASLSVELSNLESILKSFEASSKNVDNLVEYRETFIEQPVTMTINYKNSADHDTLELLNQKVEAENPSCNSSNPYNVVCKASFKKTMGLPQVCLDMKDGEQTDCSVTGAILNGGNRFYVSLEHAEGEVTLAIPKAGYQGNFTFKLDKDEKGNPACQFTNDIDPLVFREIELSEPFIEQTDPSRGVGKNYYNAKFDFKGIIHSDTWSSDNKPEYYYLMSKTNIANIKRDSNSEPMSSYLGQNCFFTNNNKYQCRFTRNSTENGTDNGDYWFYEYKIES